MSPTALYNTIPEQAVWPVEGPIEYGRAPCKWCLIPPANVHLPLWHKLPVYCIGSKTVSFLTDLLLCFVVIIVNNWSSIHDQKLFHSYMTKQLIYKPPLSGVLHSKWMARNAWLQNVYFSVGIFIWHNPSGSMTWFITDTHYQMRPKGIQATKSDNMCLQNQRFRYQLISYPWLWNRNLHCGASTQWNINPTSLFPNNHFITSSCNTVNQLNVSAPSSTDNLNSLQC